MTFALLFDLDGTLVDTEALHRQAFQVVFGRDIDMDYYASQIAGRSNDRIMAAAFPDRSVEEHLALSERKERLYRSFVGRLDPTPGLPELLDWAARHGFPCAVVTNAPRANATLVLAALGLGDRFDCVIAGDEVGRPKPHPEPYLSALAALGGDASRAVGFEDSLSGLSAAVAAGLPTFGMLTTLGEAALLQAGAIRAIQNFRDERLWEWLVARARP